MRGSAFVAGCFGEFLSTYHRIGMSQVGVHVPLLPLVGLSIQPKTQSHLSIFILDTHPVSKQPPAFISLL